MRCGLIFFASEPCVNRREVLRFEFVEIVASDGVERGALADHAGERVAIRDQHACIGPIRDADERGKLSPIQRRTPGAELRLIRVNLAKLRLDDAVHAHVGSPQGEALAQRGRDARSRPEGLGLLDREHGEIRLGENLESSAAFLCRGERADACFQFAKTFQPVEKSALQTGLRFRVGWEFRHRSFHPKQNLPRIPTPLLKRNSRRPRIFGRADFPIQSALQRRLIRSVRAQASLRTRRLLVHLAPFLRLPPAR